MTAYDLSFLPPVPPRTFRLTPGERAVLRARPEQTVSEWADGERHVEVSSRPGPWDPEITPHMVGVLDFFSLESVRDIYLAGGSQSAKTDAMHTCWGWAAVHAPGPTLIGMQDRDTGIETINDRLIPMLRQTPSLRKLVSRNPDDTTPRRIRLRNGMRTYLAWAQSEGRLASKPARYGFFDEVDLWPESAVRKGRARFRAFEDSYKLVEACTVSVESGRIWAAQKAAQLCLDFWAVCPFCGESAPIAFSGVRWDPETVDPAALSGRGDAWYECPHCQRRWDEDDRDEAVRLGAAVHTPPTSWHGWRPRDDRGLLWPRSVWIHIPPLLSRFVPFWKVAAAYLRTLTEPTRANLIDFYNDHLGLPVPEDVEGVTTSETELYKRRESYGPDGAEWQIPMAACVLTADADVQANRIEVEVLAWGEGHESWGVVYQVFHGDTSQDAVWEQLHAWAQDQTWRHESGAELGIALLGCDLGYRTDMVAKFVRRSRRYVAHKGSNQRGLPLVPRRPSKSRRYNVHFYELGTDTGKDLLHSWLTAEPGPRCCHFPQSYDFDYFRMLCAEVPRKEKDRKTGRTVTVWTLRDGVTRNEALDVRVGNMAVRQLLNPDYAALSAALTSSPKPAAVAAAPKPKKQQSNNDRRRW